MIARFRKSRYGPIGVDLGTRSVKLVQFTADGTRLLEAARYEVPPGEAAATDADVDARLTQALVEARGGKAFRGRDVVLCLNHRQLFLQNIRVPKAEPAVLDRTVQQEAAGRIPFAIADAEIRYLEAADIRQGESVLREVILMACHRPVLERVLSIAEQADLRPIAVDVEPVALVRTYHSQYRRDEDRNCRSIYVHIGHASSAVVIAQADELLFVKYLDIGGMHFDEAVARHLKMGLPDAAALRRHNGDRRSDRQDPEITRSVTEALRPVLERLASELSLCIRYHSVAFRGRPLERLVLGGGEAAQPLLETLTKRAGLPGELSDPFRMYARAGKSGRTSQWDVSAGLALRTLA